MTDITTAAPRDDNPFAPPPEAVAELPTWTPGPPGPPPLYWRMLRLHHIRPNGWQRALLVEGIFAVAVTLVLADVASAWTLIALPVAAALVVKAHDVLAGMLPGRTLPAALPPPALSDFAPFVVSAAFLLVVRLAVRSTGEFTFEIVVFALNGLLCLAIYRYLMRRN